MSGQKGNVMKILGFIGFYHNQFYDLSLGTYGNGMRLLFTGSGTVFNFLFSNVILSIPLLGMNGEEIYFYYNDTYDSDK